MKSLKLNEQLIKMKNIYALNKERNESGILYFNISLIIFFKKLLLKNFKDTSRFLGDYINGIITSFQDFIFTKEEMNINDKNKEINYLQKILIIEISCLSCLLYKFHSNINIEYSL